MSVHWSAAWLPWTISIGSSVGLIIALVVAVVLHQHELWPITYITDISSMAPSSYIFRSCIITMMFPCEFLLRFV